MTCLYNSHSELLEKLDITSSELALLDGDQVLQLMHEHEVDIGVVTKEETLRLCLFYFRVNMM